MTSELEFRPTTLDDAGFYSDVLSAVYPERPTDPVVERYWWAQPEITYLTRRFIVSRAGVPIGVADFDRPSWDSVPDRHGYIGGEILPDLRDGPTLDAIFAEMEQRLAAEGAERIAVRANDDDETRIAAILRRGFREDRRGKRWVLDLVENRARIEAMANESRKRMRAEGVELLTMAEVADPEKHSKVWKLSVDAQKDVPTTLPHPEETLEDYMQWFRAPDIREDRFWLAREGHDIVGVSVLDYPPVRGVVGTAWTATARSVRGRGIARALKCETLVQAMALGIDRVRTGNDAANDPILHINASMGYEPWVGNINFLKDVSGLL
jgi:RimJ/RimL family protein N-acetyltransferase